ncbi:unnamed protein product, partial [Oikopleura dioica]
FSLLTGVSPQRMTQMTRTRTTVAHITKANKLFEKLRRLRTTKRGNKGLRKRRIVRILKRIKKLQIARSLTADASVSETAQQEISRKKKNELVVEKSVKELVEDKKKDEHHIEVPSAKVQLQTMKISHSIMRNAPLDEEELKIVIDFELMAHKTINEFYNISLIKRMSSNFYEQETHYMKARSDQESVLQDKELSFDDISSSPNRIPKFILTSDDRYKHNIDGHFEDNFFDAHVIHQRGTGNLCRGASVMEVFTH